jgi:hypothetical protein
LYHQAFAGFGVAAMPMVARPRRAAVAVMRLVRELRAVAEVISCLPELLG